MKVDCPRCGTHIYVDQGHLAGRVECPVCRTAVTVKSVDTVGTAPARVSPQISAGPSSASPASGGSIPTDEVPADEVPDRQIPGHRQSRLSPVSGRAATATDQMPTGEDAGADLTASPVPAVGDLPWELKQEGSQFDVHRLGKGLYITGYAWVALSVLTVMLSSTVIAVTTMQMMRRGPLLSGLLLQVQIVVTLVSGVAYVGGQWLCYSACGHGSVLRLAMKKTLRNWLFAAAARGLSMLLSFPPLRIVGAFFAARSFTAFLAFLSVLASAVGRDDVTQQVHALDRFYRRSIGLVVSIVLITMILIPGARGLVMVIAGAVLAFLFSMCVFAWKKALILLRLAGHLKRMASELK